MELCAAFARPWKKHTGRLFNWRSPSQLQLLLIFSSARQDFLFARYRFENGRSAVERVPGTLLFVGLSEKAKI